MARADARRLAILLVLLASPSLTRAQFIIDPVTPETMPTVVDPMPPGVGVLGGSLAASQLSHDPLSLSPSLGSLEGITPVLRAPGPRSASVIGPTRSAGEGARREATALGAASGFAGDILDFQKNGPRASAESAGAVGRRFDAGDRWSPSLLESIPTLSPEIYRSDEFGEKHFEDARAFAVLEQVVARIADGTPPKKVYHALFNGAPKRESGVPADVDTETEVYLMLGSPPEAFGELGKEHKRLLRRKWAGSGLNWDSPLFPARKIKALLKMVRDVIALHPSPQDRIVGVGRSPEIILMMGKLLDSHPERFFPVRFSSSNELWGQDPYEPNSRDIARYREYLKSLGLDPRDIVRRPGRTVFMDYTSTGLGLSYFLRLSENWAKQLGIGKRWREKVQVHILRSKQSEFLIPGPLRGYQVAYTLIPRDINNYFGGEELKSMLANDADYYPEAWAHRKPRRNSAPREEALIRFRLMDYLAQRGWTPR